MTASINVSVTCPACSAQSDAEVWTSVNNAESPDEAQWLIDGFLFSHECPGCGNVMTLDHDCLFHDVQHKAMVLYVADPAKSADAFAALDARKPHGYTARLVASRDELREKAAILRDGLDDRAVEVAKQAVFNKFVASEEVVKDARPLYGALAEDGGIVVEFVSEQGTTETTIPRSVYDGIAESFTDVQPPVVDRLWAMAVLDKWE